MADPFQGEIKIVAFTFAPKDWVMCYGELLPIAQNTALYSLLGTEFGGDGRTNFALPDMRGRVPMQPEYIALQGRQEGLEIVQLTEDTFPQHTHQTIASAEPGNKILGSDANDMFSVSPSPIYQTDNKLQALHQDAITEIGKDKAHNNIQPSIVLKFVIALHGTYPTWA